MYCLHFSGSLIAKLVALHWKRISTGNGSDICHWMGSRIPPPENTNPTKPKNAKEKYISDWAKKYKGETYISLFSSAAIYSLAEELFGDF